MGLISRVSSRTYRMSNYGALRGGFYGGKGPLMGIRRHPPRAIPVPPPLPYAQRIKNFWNLKMRFTPLVVDYKRVCIDFVKDLPKHKAYYAPRVFGTALIIYASTHVPTGVDYKNEMIDARSKMIRYGWFRNQEINEYVQDVAKADARRLLRVDDKWVFSVVRRLNYPQDCNASEAYYDRKPSRWYNPVTWYYTLPRYLNSIVDIGFCGQFLALRYTLASHHYPDVDIADFNKSKASQTLLASVFTEISKTIPHYVPGLRPTYPQISQQEQKKLCILQAKNGKQPHEKSQPRTDESTAKYNVAEYTEIPAEITVFSVHENLGKPRETQ